MRCSPAVMRVARTPPTRSAVKAIALRGFSRLAADGVTGVSHVVEAMQSAILERLPLPGRIAPRAVGGIAGIVRRSVRGIARGIGGGIDRLVETAAPRHWHGDGSASERQLRAIANGVLGDHLAASGNPLALPMRLWIDGVAVDRDPQALAAQLAHAAPRLLLLAHGLCMSPCSGDAATMTTANPSRWPTATRRSTSIQQRPAHRRERPRARHLLRTRRPGRCR